MGCLLGFPDCPRRGGSKPAAQVGHSAWLNETPKDAGTPARIPAASVEGIPPGATSPAAVPSLTAAGDFSA